MGIGGEMMKGVKNRQRKYKKRLKFSIGEKLKISIIIKAIRHR